MAIEAESLIAPEGEIDPDLFPNDTPPPDYDEGSLLLRLETYVLKGEAKVEPYNLVDPDPAVEHWALYLAFRDAHTGMIARPASEQYLAGLGGHGYSTEQLKHIAAKRDEHLAAFEDAVKTVTPSSGIKTPQTRVVRNRYEW